MKKPVWDSDGNLVTGGGVWRGTIHASSNCACGHQMWRHRESSGGCSTAGCDCVGFNPPEWSLPACFAVDPATFGADSYDTVCEDDEPVDYPLKRGLGI